VLFPREDRILGQKIENIIMEIIELTILAVYTSRDTKRNIITRASNKTDLLKYLIRIACEIKSINTKSYINLEKEVLEIGKMFGGWLKSF
jgi:hypothetical protein